MPGDGAGAVPDGILGGGVVRKGLAVVAGALLSGAVTFLAIKAATYVPPDTEPPVITLLGEAEVEILFGEEYVEPGAEAVDERDGKARLAGSVQTDFLEEGDFLEASETEAGEVGLKIEATVPEMDVWNEGEYKVEYRAVDAAGNEAMAERTVRVVAPEPVPGAVYLTFDDGPSEYTAGLLDVLKKYNVTVEKFLWKRE